MHSSTQNPTRLRGDACTRRIFSLWTWLGLALFASVVASSNLGASTNTWDGSGSALWQTKQNWSPNSVNGGPVAGDILNFDGANAGGHLDLDLGSSNRAAASLTFVSATGANGFSFSSATAGITLTLSAGITNDDDSRQTFNVAVVAGATQTWAAGTGGLTFDVAAVDGTTAQTLTLTGSAATAINTFYNSRANNVLTNSTTGGVTIGALNLSESTTTGRTLTINGAGNTTITGVIANGTTSAASNLTYSGTGTLNVSGASTYTGVTTISSGTVRASSNADALGTGSASISLGAGTLQLASDSGLNFARATTVTASTNIVSDRETAGVGVNNTLGTLSIGANTLSVTAGSNVTSGLGGLTFGTTTFSASGTVFDVGSTASLTLGALVNNNTFTKQGAGTLFLNTASTRTGATTTLSSGILQLGTANALGTTQTTFNLNGGTLKLAPTAGVATTYNGTNVLIGGNVAVVSDRGSSGAGVVNTLGTLSIGTNTLTTSAGSNVSSGTAGVKFGATTLSGAPTFAVGSGSQLELGSLVEGATARTITKTDLGTLIFGADATSAANGSALLVNAGIAQANTAAALGTGAFGVTVNATAAGGTAAFNLNNVNQSISTLTFGGTGAGASAVNSVNTGTGILTVGGNVSYSSTNNPGTASIAGKLGLGANQTFTVADSSNAAVDLSVSAIISGTGINVTKSGAGTLAFSGANTYTGTTTVSQGVLQIDANAPSGSAGALGNASSAVTIGDASTGSSNAALLIGTSGVTVGRNVTVANLGTGTATLGGAISSGTGTFSGALTLNRATALTADSSANITFSGAIGGTGSLNKTGTGTVTLGGSSANTYSGATTVDAGTLALAKSGVIAVPGNITIGSGAANATVQLNASNQILNTATVTLANVAGTPTFNLNGNSQTLGALTSANSNAVVDLSSGSSALTVGNATSNTYAGKFTGANTGANVTKQGTGTLTLSGDSSGYTGGFTLSGGVINAQANNALGAGNVTVGNGTTLQLQGSGLALGGGSSTVTLNGAGTGLSGNDGALINVGGGTTRLNNNLALGSASTVSSGATSGATLIVGGNPPAYTIGVTAPDTNTFDTQGNKLTFVGAAGTTTRVDTRITGTGGVDVNTSGTVRYNSNQNTYTGTTNVLNGTLIVDTANNNFAPNSASTSFWGVRGPLVIGDNSGAASSAIVQLGTASGATNDAISSTQAVTINADGYFNLHGNFQNIGKLTMSGGTVDGGTLYLDYANTSVDINPTATSGAAIIGGNLSLTFLKDAATEGSLPNQTRTFNVGHDAANTSDLTVTALVGNGSLVKSGVGTMTLSTNNNTYAGSTTVSDGILNLQVGTEGSSGAHRSSLGVGDSNGSTGAGTSVSGGTLQLQGGIAITHEQLTLTGSGYNPGTGSLGALNNLSGNNTWGLNATTGTIALGGDATIASTAGTLTLASTISSTSGNNFGLTIDGAGDTTISGSINTGGSTATLTKTGTGTLTLSGANGYAGATNIQNGVVSVQSSTALGTAASGTTVSSGAEMQLSGVSVGAEALALNGTGVSGAGALRNITGNNSYGGLVTINSASLITSNSGQTFTLTGGTSSANQKLTVGKAAQNGDVNIWGMSNGTGALVKNGSGALTVTGTSTTVGNVTLNAGSLTFGSTTTDTRIVNVNGGTLNFTDTSANTGKIHLNNSGVAVSVNGGSTVSSAEIDAVAGSTLTIASGGLVQADYSTGTTTTFSGVLAGGGTFEKTGAGILVFDQSFTATNLTLELNGGTLSLLGGQFAFGTIHITGDTILDFNNSAGTVLSGSSLVIDSGVTVTVNNWFAVANNAAASTVWYATSTVNGGTLGGTDMQGDPPMDQVHFTGWGGNFPSTWVSGNHDGWYDHEIRPTPEPATYGIIFLSGSFGLLALRRYLKRRRSQNV